jgi:hypothetical protein
MVENTSLIIKIPGISTLTKTVDIQPIEVALPLDLYGSRGFLVLRILILPLMLAMSIGIPRALPKGIAEYSLGNFNTLTFLFLMVVVSLGAVIYLSLSLAVSWLIYIGLFSKGPVLRISQEGLSDIRVSTEFISWNVVEAAKEINNGYGMGGVVGLTLKPGVHAELRGTQKVLEMLSFWRKKRAQRIIIDTKTISGNKWVAMQAIIYLANRERPPTEAT